MLVYRKKSLVSHDSPLPKLVAPPYLLDKIELQNHELQAQRERWECESNTVSLQITTPYHYELTSDGVVKTRTDTLISFFESPPTMFDKPVQKTSVSIEFDWRDSLQVLKQRVIDEFSGHFRTYTHRQTERQREREREREREYVGALLID
jgi:hypothetical protein